MRQVDEQSADLVALAEAVATELEWRAGENAKVKVGAALVRGDVVAVVRPDGQIGYMPRD